MSAGDQSGVSVSGAGDVNGDGFDDLIVGARTDDPNGSLSGASFVVFGKTDGAAVELSDVEAGTGGFVINGVSVGDRSGYSVSAAGDVNGDGFDDLIVGAYRDGPNGIYSGASFVIFGGDFTGAATQVGTVGADTLTGSGADDVLIAGTGDDLLVGGGGSDVLRAGEGDDILAVSDLSFAKIDGGTGVDTLRLDGAGLSLDFTQIADPVVDDIERIDLNGDGNSVVLDPLEVLRLSETSNTVRIIGDGAMGDAVTLRGIGWSSAGTIVDPEGTFDVFTDGNATVEIEQGLNLTGGPVAAIELSDIESGIGGFVINGVSAGDESGFNVSSAGDVNGDGFEDLIVGARLDDPNGIDSGASFVVFGKTDGIAVELSDVAAGVGGFVINGVSTLDFASNGVGGAGDINGDGFADLLVGAYGDDPNGDASGASFVIFGKTDGNAVELSTIETGIGGFVINGVTINDYAGRPINNAGDVNGDGLDDLIIGAGRADPNGNFSGSSYVVFGKSDGATVELSDVEAGTGGFVINGASAEDQAGTSVSGAGDVNGDGFADLIVGAFGDDPNGLTSGASFVVFGKSDGTTVELSDVEAGTGGFVINGVSSDDRSGLSVSGGGDINGDGFADLIVGAALDDPNGSASGASFVVFGKSDGIAVELSDVEAGTGGFVINGVSADDYAGLTVSSAGDVNGDGFDDLIVGAFGDDPNGLSSGTSFVVFGKADGTAVELSDVEAGTGGFVINGVSAGDQSGRPVSAAGDVNGDGFDDLIVGARLDDPNGIDSGASFVIFGGDFTGAATQVGTVGDDTLTGSGADDVLIAGTGADEVVGGGGADVLRAGEGDDILAVSDLGFAKIDGGTGVDTLRLDGAGLTLDFGLVAAPTVTDIERIDLNGGGNSVVFDALEVLGLSGSSNTVRIVGDGTMGDAVTLRGIGWSSAGTVVDAEGTFDVFTDGNATVEIEQGLALTGGPVAPIELSDIEAGTGGFVINGVSAGDFSGRSVSSAGDVNGDGFDDLIVGGPFDDPNGGNSGASFVVFGKTDGTAVELSDVETGTGGFVIKGVSANDYSGVSVSSAGDVNGDGFADLVVGAFFDDPNGLTSGASFVVFGKTDGTAVELSDVEAGTGGFVINGVSAGDLSGDSVSSAGDVNGDGFDDLIVGGRGDDPNGLYSGASFVVFGKTDGSAVELSDIEAGSGGFVINGVFGGDRAGYSVSSAGDVNGDGFDDLIVGAYGDDPNGSLSGASFVVFGKTDGTAVELSDIEAGTGGFVINGVSGSDYSGRSVSAAGDVNGDGFADLIVGARGDDPNALNSGASFVVFGKSDGTAVELSDVEAGTGGFVINGVSFNDQSGVSVSSAGDVNGDGFDDLIVGARFDDPNGNDSGSSFVVFGKTDGAAVELSDIEAGSGGFVINGVSAGDFSGRFVSAAGDVNGDGFDDLIVGAYHDDPNGENSGTSFVIFGGDFTGAATQVGTLGDDTLTGSGADDVLIAGTGDDLLVGGDGADVLRAGEGDDILAVSDLGFVKIDGGTGLDTLRLDGAGLTLDLTQIADPVIDDIERVDLNGGGNSVTLDTLEVQRLSSTSNTVRILGDGAMGDGVTLIGNSWFNAGTVVDAEGTFDVFTDGNARVEIEQGLDLTRVLVPVELSDIEAGNGGFVINGVKAGDYTGRSVSSAGDVNGDGFDDLFVGVALEDPNGNNTGASFVVFGKTDGTMVELTDVEAGTGGFVINGASASDYSGRSVSGAGDVNGDGFDDLIVGAFSDDPNGLTSGASFVVFGKTDGIAVELSDVEAGTGGFVINGVSAADRSGASVSSAGDVNGDGFDDLIVGAYVDDPNGNDSGASFVVFGKTDGIAVELSDVEASSGGFVINGVSAGDFSGFSVSSAGDVNGDGFDDLIVGGRNDDPNGAQSGASFVVFGKSDGTAVELSDVETGSGGFVINGVSAGDSSGVSVSSAGDVNGDGFDDLIVGANYADPNGFQSGASFVVFGKTDGSVVELSAIEDSANMGGFVINGVSVQDQSGFSVSGAGDVDGDGFDDLIVGAFGDDPNGFTSGASFVVFGKADGTVVELSDVEAGTGGFVINGVSAGDGSGRSVSAAGDVNGDGFDDLIVGAPNDDPNGIDSGASFVIFGGDFTGVATQIGTVGADTLTGSNADDALFAGAGDDTLEGGGGVNRLSGGQGDDDFIFENLGGSTTIIDFEGGAGTGDQLDVSDFGFVDFAAFQAVASASGPGGHDTLIQLDVDDSILLEDFEVSQLNIDDVLLV